MTKRVVVTGMAITSPLGSSLNSVYERLHKLENCVQYDESLDIYKGLSLVERRLIKKFYAVIDKASEIPPKIKDQLKNNLRKKIL